MLVWLPISCGLIGSVFDGGDYVLAYLLFMGLALPLSILGCLCRLSIYPRADLSLGALCRLCGVEPDCLGGQLAALLAEPLRVGAVGRFLQFPHLSVRSLDAAHLAGRP